MQSDECQLQGAKNSSAPTRTTEIEVIGNFFSYQAKVRYTMTYGGDGSDG
jgi:hypothetical protein